MADLVFREQNVCLCVYSANYALCNRQRGGSVDVVVVVVVAVVHPMALPRLQTLSWFEWVHTMFMPPMMDYGGVCLHVCISIHYAPVSFTAIHNTQHTTHNTTLHTIHNTAQITQNTIHPTHCKTHNTQYTTHTTECTIPQAPHKKNIQSTHTPCTTHKTQTHNT